MATKQCHTCPKNGKGDPECLTCKSNVSTKRRNIKPIDPVTSQIPAPEPEEKDEGKIAEFFREWLFLPPRLRDVFAALYVNRFVLAEAARQLQIGVHQASYARDALRAHAYFGKFFEGKAE